MINYGLCIQSLWNLIWPLVPFGSCNWYFRVLSSVHSKSKFKRLGYVWAIHGEFLECEHHPSLLAMDIFYFFSHCSRFVAQTLTIHSIHHHPSTGAEHIQHAANSSSVAAGKSSVSKKKCQWWGRSTCSHHELTYCCICAMMCHVFTYALGATLLSHLARQLHLISTDHSRFERNGQLRSQQRFKNISKTESIGTIGKCCFKPSVVNVTIFLTFFWPAGNPVQSGQGVWKRRDFFGFIHPPFLSSAYFRYIEQLPSLTQTLRWGTCLELPCAAAKGTELEWPCPT